MNNLDALIFASSKFNIDKDNWTKLCNANKFSSISQSCISFDDDVKNFNNILDKTTLKRACCLKKENALDNTMYEIDVRIPIPTDYKVDTTTNKGILENKYGYIDKTILVPKQMCNTLTLSEEYCNNFYKIYCLNALDEYKRGNNGKFDSIEFQNFKNECSCYGDIPPEITNIVPGIPPKCVLPGCDISGDVYVDPISKKSDCDITICQAIINEKDISAGGDTGIVNKITQKCGQNSSGGDSGNGGNTTTSNLPYYLSISGSLIGLIIVVIVIFLVISYFIYKY